MSESTRLRERATSRGPELCSRPFPLLLAACSALTACATTPRPSWNAGGIAGPPSAVARAARDSQQERSAPAPAQDLELFANSLAAHQPDASLEGGGELAVTRAFLEPGLRFALDPRLTLSFAVGASIDEYDFDGAPGALGAEPPWDTIHGLRLGVGLRWFASDRWLVLGAPSLRFAAEEGASLSDGMQGGLIAGAAYRLSETLSIGPGFGLYSQIEDSPSAFPILLVRWRLAEQLVLETGRGLGATQGPGLTLAWRPDEDWELLAGGRYDQRRFRLDDEGPAPEGVGEERELSLFTSLSRALGKDARIGLFAGVALGSALKLEDAQGDELAEADLDSAPFVGLVLQL